MTGSEKSGFKWYAVSGSRSVNARVAADIKADISRIFSQEGAAIKAGGAPGVDYLAIEEALKHDPECTHIRIIIPTSLEVYEREYAQRVKRGMHQISEIRKLMGQLRHVRSKNPEALVEMKAGFLDSESFHARNTRVIEGVSGLFAYQVNGSTGVQDTIDKARKMGIKVFLKTYRI